MRRAKIPYEVQARVYFRDKWLCHICLRPIIFAPTFRLLDKWVNECGYQNPLAYYHPNWRRDAAPLLDDLGAVIDHEKAHSKTQDDSETNLFAACNKCNTRKSDGESEELLKRERLKNVKGLYGEPQNWDGLVSLFILLAEKYSSELTTTEKQWLKVFREILYSKNAKTSKSV